MKIQEVISFLEEWAPPAYQESYDNSGLICGNREDDLKGILICLDSIEEVVEEAIEKGANLVIAHHPIIFKGLKSLTGSNYVERTIIKAIKNDINIYAIHTNLDSINTGVNFKIAERLGLKNCRILRPKTEELGKLSFFVPLDSANKVRDAVFSAGAGSVGNYSECSFNLNGEGTFKPSDNANPTIGNKGERHSENEVSIEVLYPIYAEGKILKALKNSHPYEEVAYFIHTLRNRNQTIGSGMVGELSEELDAKDFILSLKKKMNTQIVRHTATENKRVKRIALCGGSGSFLLQAAISQKADVFLSGDFKYHEFFDADNKIIITDIGHYESEQFTMELILEKLSEKFSNFAIHLTTVNTNPINYI